LSLLKRTWKREREKCDECRKVKKLTHPVWKGKKAKTHNEKKGNPPPHSFEM